MKIQITELTKETVPCAGTYQNDWGFTKSFNGFRVNEISGTRVYITVFNDQMKLTRIAKKMEFKDGEISVKIGNDTLLIGKYITAA